MRTSDLTLSAKCGAETNIFVITDILIDNGWVSLLNISNKWIIHIGVAVGCGWQQFVAYVNIGCYYIVGVPLGALLGFVFKLGVKVLESHALTFLLCTRLSTLNTLLVSCWQGIWGGMIGGTVMQTAILLWVTLRTDWSKEVAITESYRRKDKIFVSILHQVSHS